MGTRGFLAALAFGASLAASGEAAPFPVQCPAQTIAGAVCFELSVPEDRARPGGRKIGLHIVRLGAAHPSGGAIFVFQGGPGQAATTLADFYAETYAEARKGFDIVLVDQRGTGLSNGLTCRFRGSEANPQGYLDDIFDLSVINTCRDELSKRADLRFYTTDAAVADAEAVRSGFGYARIDLYGTSYGTRVAMEYSRRFPTHVRTMTLKGVLDPDSVAPASFASDVERSVKLMQRDCAADAGCAKAFPDSSGDLKRVVERLEKRPQTADLGDGHVVMLTRGLFGAGVRTMLQSVGLRAATPFLLHAAANNRWYPLIKRVMELRSGAQKEIATGMMLSVLCTEDVPYLDVETAGQEAAGTVLGSYWVDQAASACTKWPRGAVPAGWRKPYKTGAPTLLISGDLDPATPPSNADAATKYLTDPWQVLVPAGSHSFSGLKGCVDKLMSDFVAKGGRNGVDPSCAEKIAAPPFQTK